jgi:hypothetical protein
MSHSSVNRYAFKFLVLLSSRSNLSKRQDVLFTECAEVWFFKYSSPKLLSPKSDAVASPFGPCHAVVLTVVLQDLTHLPVTPLFATSLFRKVFFFQRR